MRARKLEITFNASGAADAGARGRVVAIVDVVDSSTSAEAAVSAGAAAVLGASPAGTQAPVRLDPGAVGRRAAGIAGKLGTDVVVVAEPRVGPDDPRRARSLPVLQALTTAGVRYELAPNQGAELVDLVNVDRRVVVLVSATGGSAFDAALAAGAPAACFVTTARVTGRTGWDLVGIGARRAIAVADENARDLTVVAASANSADDCLAAFEIGRRIITEGFLRL
ncbi:MAG: hypothetical protein ACRDKA_03685 [Actinomycetota bacterium]